MVKKRALSPAHVISLPQELGLGLGDYRWKEAHKYYKKGAQAAMAWAK